MNLSKLTKAQLIEMIGSLQDELTYMGQQCKAEASDIPWEEQPAAIVIQAPTKSHAETMRERMAAAKAQAMATGKAVKA